MSHSKIYATPKKWLNTAIACFLCLLIGVGTSIAYTNYVDRKSNRYWCELMGGLDQRNKALPENAPQEAKDFAADVDVLISKLEC